MEGRYVPAREYEATARAQIDGAKRSVALCLYLFTLRTNQSTSGVFQLAEALVRAHRRGVAVEVLLDQNINFAEDGERGSDAWEGKNRSAYAYLKSQGVDVAYDDSSTYTHTKALVIDEETVLLGSTNWSDSALNRNEEGNLLVRSKDIARDALNAIRAVRRRDPLANHDDRVVPLPLDLQTNGTLGRMARRSDERALDVYLHLLRREQSGTPAPVDVPALAAELGIERMTPLAYRRQIIKTLRKLRDRYGLIELTEPTLAAQTVLRSTDIVPLPEGYLDGGWNRRLSLAGKVFWIINLAESRASSRRPRWSVNQRALARRYGVSPWFLGKGLMELRRQNLVEVEYSSLPGPNEGPRAPTVYTPNALYDPAAWEAKRAALAAKHGEETLKRAEAVAALVFEDKDLNGIEELVELETRLGPRVIQRAAAILGAKSTDNPRRSMAYLLGTVRKLSPMAPPVERQ
jgi:cardiolipin synthase